MTEEEKKDSAKKVLKDKVAEGKKAATKGKASGEEATEL